MGINASLTPDINHIADGNLRNSSTELLNHCLEAATGVHFSRSVSVPYCFPVFKVAAKLQAPRFVNFMFQGHVRSGTVSVMDGYAIDGFLRILVSALKRWHIDIQWVRSLSRAGPTI